MKQITINSSALYNPGSKVYRVTFGPSWGQVLYVVVEAYEFEDVALEKAFDWAAEKCVGIFSELDELEDEFEFCDGIEYHQPEVTIAHIDVPVVRTNWVRIEKSNKAAALRHIPETIVNVSNLLGSRALTVKDSLGRQWFAGVGMVKARDGEHRACIMGLQGDMPKFNFSGTVEECAYWLQTELEHYGAGEWK